MLALFLSKIHLASTVNRQFVDKLVKQTKRVFFSKKTVDATQSDLHNTRHLLRGKVVNGYIAQLVRAHHS